MSIGDVNSEARGSGARYNDGKPDFSLIPFRLLEGEARVWMHGERKYARNNWMKGMQWSVPFASLMRHLSAWQAGQDFDPETGEHHLDHASCNIRMLRLYADSYREGDDRPKQWMQGGEPVECGGCAPPVIASPAAMREAKIAHDMACERIPKWSLDWINSPPNCDGHHPMQAEALRDHDERLAGGESHL